MKVTVLGSGTSSGVPVIGCQCKVCQSDNPKNKRMRSSCHILANGKSLLIDTSPDLRMQALSFGVNRVDAVLYTHIHADHVHGIDEMRLYNVYQKASIPCFGDRATLSHLQKHFNYVFNPPRSYPSLIPRLTAKVREDDFTFEGILIQPLWCHHGPQWMTLNYRIGPFAWLTDTSDIPEKTLAKLQGLDYLFLDSVRLKPHPTHLHFEKAFELAKKIGAKQTYFIHLSHDYDHDEFEKKLPSNFGLAFDGLSITLDDERIAP